MDLASDPTTDCPSPEIFAAHFSSQNIPKELCNDIKQCTKQILYNVSICWSCESIRHRIGLQCFTIRGIYRINILLSTQIKGKEIR